MNLTHAEKCPVCSGSGTVPSEGTAPTKPCHGCKGLGWISVPNFAPAQPAYPFYPVYPSVPSYPGIPGEGPWRPPFHDQSIIWCSVIPVY